MELSTCNGGDLQLFGIDVDPDYGGLTALPHSNFPAAKQRPYPPVHLEYCLTPHTLPPHRNIYFHPLLTATHVDNIRLGLELHNF